MTLGANRTPTLRPCRRLLGLVGVLAVLVAAGSAPTPVGALEQQPGIRVEENQTVEREFGPIAGQDPLPAEQLSTPDSCRTAAYCDVIPLEVVLPADLVDSDEFFVAVELRWETPNLPSTPASGTQAVNDLDLYVWDDPAGESEIAHSEEATEPEALRLYRPVKGRYQIVVHNFRGANTGYRLKVSYVTEILEKPFESLEPGFEPPPFPLESVPAEPPVDLSGEPEPEDPADNDRTGSPVAAPEPVVVPPAAPEPVSGLPLEPVEIEPDSDFADFDDADFEEALAAPPDSDVLRQRETRAVGPVEPASAGSVVFWLVIVPLVAVTGGAYWLMRRGSARLRMR